MVQMARMAKMEFQADGCSTIGVVAACLEIPAVGDYQDVSDGFYYNGAVGTEDACNNIGGGWEYIADTSTDTGTSGEVETPNCLLTECAMSVDLGNGFGADFALIDQIDDPGIGGGSRYSVPNAFYIMTTEVTQGMFQQVLGYDSRQDYNEDWGLGSNHPAYFVNWHMAADFANALSTLAGEQLCYSCSGSESNVMCSETMDPNVCTGYALPTEHERELAARSGIMAEFWTGEGSYLGGATFNGTGCDPDVIIYDGASGLPSGLLLSEIA